jgi:molecular chaperone GrpE
MEDEKPNVSEQEAPPEVDGDGALAHIPVEDAEAETADERVEKHTPETNDDLVDALRRQMLRLRADFDNYRKRTLRDQNKQRRDGENTLLSKLLPVIDDFETGLAAAREHDVPASAVDGFGLIHNQLLALLGDYDVHALETVGKAFDPHWHESIGQEPSATCPEGHVTTELRRGYSRDGVLLRPARVLVSSGSSTGEEAAP